MQETIALNARASYVVPLNMISFYDLLEAFLDFGKLMIMMRYDRKLNPLVTSEKMSLAYSTNKSLR